jgi:hypothetical protein
MWMDWKLRVAVPHDMLVPGYGGHTINYLRLYSVRSSREFDMQIFNDGDYFKAVEQKMQSANITKVLCPSDAVIPSSRVLSCQGGSAIDFRPSRFIGSSRLTPRLRLRNQFPLIPVNHSRLDPS